MKTGNTPIAIPGSDSALAAYGGFTLCQISFTVAGSSDLILYDNPTTNSGNIVAVISHTASPGTIQVQIQPITGLYAKNGSGWTGTIWTS